MMHLFVLIITLSSVAFVPNGSYAQNRSVESYTPPPMFGTGDSEPEHEYSAPGTSAIPETSEIPAPRAAHNLDIINLDSISGRAYSAPSPNTSSNVLPMATPSKILKPPLPPRRPTSYHVSQDYLDRITSPVLPAVDPLPKTVRGSAPVISPTALDGDSLNQELLAMDVMDIYRKLGGEDLEHRNYINVPSNLYDDEAIQAPDPANGLRLAFSPGSATFTEAHAIQIDGDILPLLQGDTLRLVIDAPSLRNAHISEHRLALARAIAVRNYLELNGIKRDRITINQNRHDPPMQNRNAVTVGLLE